MKPYFIILLVLALFASCAGNKKLGKVEFSDQNSESTDSIEYELIVFDPGFDTWYIMRSKPSWYHSQNYYELWNRQYVSAWNTKVTSPRYSRIFESLINYEPFTDYGLEINHKLFYFFQYVERELKIPILPSGTGPQTVL